MQAQRHIFISLAFIFLSVFTSVYMYMYMNTKPRNPRRRETNNKSNYSKTAPDPWEKVAAERRRADGQRPVLEACLSPVLLS